MKICKKCGKKQKKVEGLNFVYICINSECDFYGLMSYEHALEEEMKE